MRVLYLMTMAASLVAALPQYLDGASVSSLHIQEIQRPHPQITKREASTYDLSGAADEKSAAQIVAGPLRRRDTSARREKLEKRDLIRRAGNCAAYSKGYAPKTYPDTASSFLANPVYAQISVNATSPQGYSLAFQGLDASISSQQPGEYLYTITYQHYNTLACQRACDAATGCTAFNMYIERSPSLDVGAGCPNPPAVFNYRCSLWASNNNNDQISVASASYKGQLRGPTDGNGTAFQTAITASNAYVKNVPPPEYKGFAGPIALPGAIRTSNAAFIGQRSWPGVYDPSLCAAVCLEMSTTAAAVVIDGRNTAAKGDQVIIANPNGGDEVTGSSENSKNQQAQRRCSFFNSFVVGRNNVPQGTQCHFFSSSSSEKTQNDNRDNTNTNNSNKSEDNANNNNDDNDGGDDSSSNSSKSNVRYDIGQLDEGFDVGNVVVGGGGRGGRGTTDDNNSNNDNGNGDDGVFLTVGSSYVYTLIAAGDKSK